MEVPVPRQEVHPVPSLRAGSSGGRQGGQAGVLGGAGGVARSAVVAEPKPTELPAILSAFLGGSAFRRGISR